MEAKISKRYSSLKSLLNPFNFSDFLPSGPHKSTVFGIFEILSFRFLTIFLNSPLYPIGKPKNLNYLQNERPYVERNGATFGPRE